MKTAQASPGAVDEYIAGFPRDVPKILKRVRNTIRKAAPDAEEAITYQIPTFVLNGNLVHFAAIRNRVGFYPTPSTSSDSRTSCLRTKTKPVRFPVDKPMPLSLIEKIGGWRAMSAAGGRSVRQQVGNNE